MTRPFSLALTCALLTIACGEKKAPASSGDAAEETPAEETSANNLPDDKASQAFGEALADLEIHKFHPTDDGVLIYDSLSFETSGTWTAAAAIEVMDERMECAESGSWTMDPAESEDQATMSWTVDDTNCAGRESGYSQRAKVDLSAGRFDISFR